MRGTGVVGSILARGEEMVVVRLRVRRVVGGGGY